MKTLKELKADLVFSRHEIRTIRQQKIKGERTIVKKISMIKNAILYLEYDPQEKSALRQLEEVTHRLKVIEEGFEVWYKNLGTTKNDKKIKRSKGLNTSRRWINLNMSQN